MIKNLKLLTVLGLLLCAYHVKGQDWIVPEDALTVKNPLEYNLENVEAGKAVYLKNCKSCHGDPGKNNPLPLVPSPVDIASEKMHLNNDGALFYKISKGRGTMLQFELTLSETEIWSVISFITNYKPGGIQLLVDLPPVKARMSAMLISGETQLEVIAEYETEQGTFAKLSETPVIVSVKRAFGNLEVGQTNTDADGKAVYSIPEGLIRDDKGLLTLAVSLNDDYEAETVYLEGSVIGTPKDMPEILGKGVLYSTNDRIPFWLLLSYFGVVGGIWLVIGYVVFQIIKLKKLR